MNMQLLKDILTAYGPSGHEGRVADVIRTALEGHVDEIYTDAMGSLIARFPSSPGATGSPSESRTYRSYPGTGTVGEPALIGIGSSPRRLEAIGHPVSVCHQLSTTGVPRFSVAHW